MVILFFVSTKRKIALKSFLTAVLGPVGAAQPGTGTAPAPVPAPKKTRQLVMEPPRVDHQWFLLVL
jgi:hypothetical protein